MSILKADGSIDFTKAAALAKKYEDERQKNFANPPKNCKHGLVYNKQGDDMHCHYCDKFMYNQADD